MRKYFVFAWVGALFLNLFITSPAFSAPKKINWSTSDIQFFSASTLTVSVAQTQGMFRDQYICAENRFSGCNRTEPYLLYQALVYLPNCEANNSPTVCIEGVEKQQGNKPWAPLTYKTDFAVEKLPKDTEHGLPEGSGPSYWHDAQSDSGVLIGSAIQYSGNLNTFNAISMFSSIVPVKLNPSSTSPGKWIQTTASGTTNSVAGWRSPTGCSAQGTSGKPPLGVGGDGFCAIEDIFPSDTKWKLILHLPVSLSNWYFGRIGFPQVEISPISSSISRMTISGEVVNVQDLTGVVDGNDPTLTGWGNYMLENSKVVMLPSADWTMKIAQSASTSGVIQASEKHLAWNVNSIPTNLSLRNSSCFTTSIAGVVTTDSPIYSPTSPTFVDGSLNYQLAGSHFDVSGKLAEAQYSLLINRDLAKCLYPESANDPIAQVQVTSDDGSLKVVTTTLKVNASWLAVNVGGITFSSPTVKVKLAGKAPAPQSNPSPSTQAEITKPNPNPISLPTLSTPSPASSKTPVAKKILYVNCVKGKFIKKIVSTQKCPVGYKRK